jgi:chromosome segregation ATPase
MEGDQRVGAEAEVGSTEAVNGSVGDHSERELALERRLQALVEAEQGARDQLHEEAERRIEEARHVLDEARAESERDRRERAELTQRLDAETRAKREKGKELEAARSQIDTLKSELELTRSELDQASAGMHGRDELLRALEGGKRKLEKARAEIHRKDEELVVAERAVSDARREIENELRSRQDLEKSIEGIKAQAARSVAEARTKVEEELRARIESERQLQQALGEAERLSAEVESVRTTLERTASERDDGAKAAKEQQRELGAQVERSAKENSLLAKRLETAGEWEAAARTENESLKSELKSAKASLDATTQQVAELERALAEAKARDERQRSEWRALRDRNASERSELEARVNELMAADAKRREELERQESMVDRLQESLAAAERRATQRAEALEEERRARSEVEKDLAAALAEAARSEKEVAVVEQRIAEALDRRLKATIDSESQARELVKRHDATVEARKAELADLNNRIEQTRGVLVEAQAAAQQHHNERVELEERLKSLGGSAAKGATVTAETPAASEPQAPPAPEAANGKRRSGPLRRN